MKQQTAEEIGERIGRAMARDVLADHDTPRDWTGLDPQDADQIPPGVDRAEVEIAAEVEYRLRMWGPDCRESSSYRLRIIPDEGESMLSHHQSHQEAYAEARTLVTRSHIHRVAVEVKTKSGQWVQIDTIRPLESTE